jgi:transcriptional regulator with XRE-family HTH domain
MFCNLKTIKTNQIRRYRKKRCLRQQDIANRLGLKFDNYVYRWESGNKVPSLMNALKLSAALNCPLEILYLDHFKQIQNEMYPEKSNLKTT